MPCKVTEFVAGLQDPWDVVEWRDLFLVSERALNRIVAFDKAGRLVRVVVESNPAMPGTARLNTFEPRMMFGGGTLAERQAQPCLGPEGLYVLDDWLYFGSAVQKQVRRVHMLTGEVQVYALPYTDGNTKFMKIALSDGTFGPRGTLFYQQWSTNFEGTAACVALLPGPLPLTLAANRWNYVMTTLFGTEGYGSAVGVGGGRLFVGQVTSGLVRFSLADRALNRDLFKKGRDEFEAMHGTMKHGRYGYGSHRSALPWGQSDALDYYLTTCGHVRPAEATQKDGRL